MGWDCSLEYSDKIAQVPRHSEGSIISIQNNGIQGKQDADISITYNYSGLYRLVIDNSLKDYLNGKKAKETIPTLKLLVEKLGTDQYKRQVKQGLENVFNPDAYEIDYWCPTMGNAGHICAILLDWANLHPDAVWRCSG